MASLREIKDRIASVGGTLKITSAMKMVASAKLHRAQQAIGNMLPYEKRLHGMLIDLMGSMNVSAPASEDGSDRLSGLSDQSDRAAAEGAYSLMVQRKVRRVAVVAFASNSSLCGAFNSNAVREASAVVNEHLAAGLRPSDIVVYSVGRKMAEAMRKLGFPSPADFTKMSGSPSYEAASVLAQELLDGFVSGRFDKVELVYNHYKSTSSQPTVRQTYLPLSLTCATADLHAGRIAEASAEALSSAAVASSEGSVPDVSVSGEASAEAPASSAVAPQPVAGPVEVPASSTVLRQSHHPGAGSAEAPAPSAAGTPDLIIEPSPEELIKVLLPKVVRLGIFSTLLDSAAAEHAARTVAMQLATDNGNELLQDLTLEYNKGRQGKITSEILDLIGGSMQ